jgi:predicted nucleic acid-binding protein
VTVVDASLLVEAMSEDATGTAAYEWLTTAIANGELLDTAALAAYEVASALVKMGHDGRLQRSAAVAIWERIRSLPLVYHELEVDGLRTMEIAHTLRRRSAYDAAYLALAERLDSELLTLDGPLARNATALGFRVTLVE